MGGFLCIFGVFLFSSVLLLVICLCSFFLSFLSHYEGRLLLISGGPKYILTWLHGWGLGLAGFALAFLL